MKIEDSPVCVQQQAAQTNSLSIASSTNKTDDDELPFHLLQHSTHARTHGRQSLLVARPRSFVHVGDCVCARLKQSSKPGFQDLVR